jgi:hypothetical protein
MRMEPVRIEVGRRDLRADPPGFLEGFPVLLVILAVQPAQTLDQLA